MLRGPKYFLVLSMLAIIAIVWYRYDQYVLKRNFLTMANVPCDPATESCFVMDCSPEEDEECDITPYKKAETLAFEAPSCLEEHVCESFTCANSDLCELTYCAEDTLEDGEVCAEPVVPEPEPVEEPEEIEADEGAPEPAAE